MPGLRQKYIEQKESDLEEATRELVGRFCQVTGARKSLWDEDDPLVGRAIR